MHKGHLDSVYRGPNQGNGRKSLLTNGRSLLRLSISDSMKNSVNWPVELNFYPPAATGGFCESVCCDR